MSSSNHHQYPPVPANLSASDHDLQDYYVDSKAPAPAHTTPYYTPYLGLRSRLSQVWINRWTILLLLILCRLLISTTSLNDDIVSAKAEALSACTSVEKVGSSMASMPHYLSEGVNALAADGITKAVNALMQMLTMTVTGVQELILFFINMLTSTYVCLITLVIAGSLRVALDMIQKVTEFVDKAVDNIAGEVSGAVSDFEKGFNGFLDNIDIGGIFGGGSSDPPKIDLSKQITSLKDLDIDTAGFTADLNKLNASIPTFAEVQNFTNSAIRFPFEQVKKLINESMSVYTFDRSVFPLAPKKQLTFCTDNPAINNFFDSLLKVVFNAKRAFMIVLIILAVLVCVPMAWREIKRWRTMKQRALLLHRNSFDPLDVIYIASRPYTGTVGIKIASKFKSPRKQILVRWVVAYATSVPALFVLSLGIAGLFSCLCQYIVLKVIEKEVPALASQVGDFTETIVLQLNNASQEWAVSANGVVAATNTEINQEVFGWVNTTTTAVNATLNTFVSEMSKGLNATFGGTILHDPIKEVLNCLIGLKVVAVQRGLNWVSENAKVSFPQFRPDVFSLGAAASLTSTTKDDSFLSSPGSVATDDITGAVLKVSNKLQRMIREEAIISSCVVGIWLLITLIGIGRAIFGMVGRDKTRAEGGPVGYTGDERGEISSSPRSPKRRDHARFPAFGKTESSIGGMDKSSDDLGWGERTNEKGEHRSTGKGGHRSVEASVMPGKERSSSYGMMSGGGGHNEKR